MKKVTFPLVVILTLSLILGPMGCGKRPSAVIPPSIVEMISPSSGASGIAADEAITIQFKSPIWASQMTVPASGEPLQMDSSELADRLRIIDAATGEIVPGRVTIEDGVKLTFELPAGERWKPNNTYWIEGTADASLEEAYEEGAWQNLFFSAFTTQDLDADQFPVHHPIGGSLAQLLNDIAYDVDTSRSLSFDELKSWIENAPSEAEGTSLTKFHFWPNIINLTEVYYAEDNHALFNDILDQLLEREPDSAQLKSQLTAQVARGDRVFCARDFISSLRYGFKTYWEVQYGLLINLDNPDQTGTRRPYVQEILVHEYNDEGLPLLHDPHTEKLAAIFAASTAIPLGKAWDLCLRGNLKNTKYNAIVVDKLAEAPDAEFYIERVELTCGCDIFSDLDTSVPSVPWKPWNPWNPVPVPVWEPQPLPNPNPPKNPHAPPNPKPGPGGPPVEPWPFPPDPIPLPKFPEEEPEEEEGPEVPQKAEQGTPCSQWPTKDCTRKLEVQSKLEQTEKSQKEQEKKWKKDQKTVNDMIAFTDPDGMQKVEFNDPCLQKLRDEYVKKAKELDEPAKKLWEGRPPPYKGIERPQDIEDPVMRALVERKGWWGMILHEKGPWSTLSGEAGTFLAGVPTEYIMIAEQQSLAFDRLFSDALLGERERNEARRILNDPQAKKEDKEKAQELLSTPPQRVAAKTWDQAVREAVNAMVAATQKELEKEGREVTQKAMQMWTGIWQEYAKLRMKFYKNQLEILIATSFFGVDFPELKGLEAGELKPEGWEKLKDKLTPGQKEQLEKMIKVVFEGEEVEFKDGSKLTPNEKEEYARIKKALEDRQKLMDENSRLAYEAYRQKEQLNDPFRWKAWRCCLVKSVENERRLFQQGLILEEYLKWCELEDQRDMRWPAIPSYRIEYVSPTEWKRGEPVVYEVEDKGWNRNIAKLRYCAVLCDIRDNPEFANLRGLRTYAEWLISCKCEETTDFPFYRCVQFKCDCDKMKEPCDPECEVCPGKTPTPVVTPGVTPPPTYTIPPTITPPPTEVTPPPTETLPPTTQVLRADASANAESLRDQSGCSSTLTISYNAQDLTAGSYPVTKVVLTVNGQPWHDSGTISQVTYQNAVTKQVGCGQTFSIQVTATNESGQMVIVPGSITTPTP